LFIEAGSISSLSIECRYTSIYKYHWNKTSFVHSQKVKLQGGRFA